VSVRAEIVSGRSRPGQRFQPIHELALADDLVRAARDLPGAPKGLLVQIEMPGPIGIPDATALVGDPTGVRARISCGVEPILNRLDVAIISAMPNGAPRTIDLIARELGWGVETVDRRMSYLLRSGAVAKEPTGSFIRRSEIRALGRIYALEAKVNNVNAALRQARAYAAWADAYVLVMGPLSKTATERIKVGVTSDRGGLMVDGRWLRRPRLRPPTPALRLWASEFFVASLVSSGVHHPSPAP
jgi:hypothetical protein